MHRQRICGSLRHGCGLPEANRRCCPQIDMPPQNVLYYVPAQRAWVTSEVEELIEVSLYCLSVFCFQLVQLHNGWDPGALRPLT